MSDLRKTLFDDVCMLVFMKPLLDAGFVQFFTPEMHSCSNCLGAFFGSFEGKVDRGYERLVRDYYKNSTVSLIGYNKRLCKFELEGPEPFYDHSVIMTYPGTKGRIRELIVNKPRLLDDLSKKKRVQLSRTLTKELGLHRRFAGSVASSATFGILSAKILSASFLTDNSLDLTFLSGLSNSSQINTRNDISLKHLTSIVPFLPDVPVSNLIKLRKREQEAFINFRGALNKAIEEFKSSKTPLTEKQAKEMYSDLISPRLAKLDFKVKNAKRDLVKKAVRSVAAVVGVISFGLYSGLISVEFAELIKTLGLGKIAIDILEKSVPWGGYVYRKS